MPDAVALDPMRCPSCHDEYEPDVRSCATCGIPLVPTDAPAEAGAPLPRADARLGTFHPAVAATISSLLEGRGIAHDELTEEGRVTLLIDRDWRDDVRAELTITWGDLVRRLPEEQVVEVLGAGGPNPGWFDPPRGGYVDRQGRLVVDVDDGEDAEDDAARVLGPALLTLGAVLLVVGWYVMDSGAIAVTGLGLVLLGLFMPR
jgi:hypothetical protein